MSEGRNKNAIIQLAPAEEQLLECLRAYVLGGAARLIIDPSDAEQRGGLFALARAHKLLPVVCGTLKVHEALFADEAGAAARGKARLQAAASALRSHEFCGLIEELRRRGHEPVVLKGELLKRLYSEPHSRLSSDEDLYLEGAEAEACAGALAAMGFKKSSDDGEVVALNQDNGLHIELHRALFTGRGRLQTAGERLKKALARTRYDEGGEARLRCFAPADEVFYLICHAAKHFASCGFGVRTAADIAAYTMKEYGELDFNELESLLEAAGLIRFASGVYDMAAKHMGYDKNRFPLPFLCGEDGEFIACGGAMLKDCLAGGVYGKSTAERTQSAKYSSGAERGGTHACTLLRAVFPPKEALAGEYPFVEKCPLLLPAAWGARLIKYLASGRRDAQSGAALGRERIRLLKDYGMGGAPQTGGAQGKAVRRVRAAELMPLYLEAMEERGSVTFPVSGGSMSPFLTHLRDSVTLTPIGQERIRRGDIVLYTRPGGRYVMHRVVGVRRDGYVFCGDAETEREFGVKRESMLAMAKSAVRKGKSIDEHSPAWLFYKHIWRVMRPVRRGVLKLYSMMENKK